MRVSATYSLSDEEKAKITHDALLREIHTVDGILETHASVMTALAAGLLYLAFQLKPGLALDAVSVLGFGFSFEMFLHTYRFRDLANSARERLEKLEDKMGIDAKRKPTMIWKMRVPSGSNLILTISLLLMATWVGFLIAVVFYGLIPSALT